jgi:16S rRNA processing protein RimM
VLPVVSGGDPADSVGFVTLARVVRPHGRKGEVAAEVLTDFPERLTTLREVYLWDGASARRTAIRACRLHRGQAIFHFEGTDSISDAERLRGAEVRVPLAERVHLPPDRYYITDLIGCAVFQKEAEEAHEAREANEKQSSFASSTSSASFLGRVRDVQFTGEAVRGTPVLIVDTPRGELLVPFAKEICTRIDVAGRRIEVALPEGLREMNESSSDPGVR